VILAITACVSQTRAEVRIGAAGPLTGTMAWFGEQHERGVGMADGLKAQKAT
jgi:ABC-type branched-subunit amino acid transport system substrate-binding protein